MAYKRKTYDEWQIQGCYNGAWECVCTEDCRIDARDRLKEYRENEIGTTFRIQKKRVKIEPKA
jgi:hypothetical protein